MKAGDGIEPSNCDGFRRAEGDVVGFEIGVNDAERVEIYAGVS